MEQATVDGFDRAKNTFVRFDQSAHICRCLISLHWLLLGSIELQLDLWFALPSTNQPSHKRTLPPFASVIVFSTPDSPPAKDAPLCAEIWPLTLIALSRSSIDFISLHLFVIFPSLLFPPPPGWHSHPPGPANAYHQFPLNETRSPPPAHLFLSLPVRGLAAPPLSSISSIFYCTELH